MQYDEEYFNSSDFRDILEGYEASIEAGEHPFMDVDDLVDIADYYSWHNQNDKAEQTIDYALEMYPDATLPNVFKARKALLDGDFALARHYAAAIVSRDDPDYHYLTAEIMIAAGDIDGADRYLREYAKSVDPDEYEDFVRDCANLYIDYEESDKAYEWMMRSRGDNSDDFKELMARTLFGIGKYKDSERLWNELVDQHPFSKNYWNALASTQMMSEDYPNAITSSEYAIAIDPQDPDAVCGKANGLFRLGNYEEALKYFRQYCEMIPDDEYGLLHQGVCLVNLDRNEEALPVLRTALALNPKESAFRAQIYQELAFCYSSLHDVRQALAMLAYTEKLNCDHVDMLVVKGHILLQNGRIDDAEESFKEAVLRSDNSPDVMLRVILSLYDNGYYEACHQMIIRFFRLVKEYYPDYPAEEIKKVLSYITPKGMTTDEYMEIMNRTANSDNQ